MDATPISAPELAARILGGDASAETALVERYDRPVRLILLKRTGDAQLAADLAQDTFVIALQKLRAGELRNPAALPSFLHQIAVNRSIEHFRKEKRYVSGEDGIIALQPAHRDRKAENVDRRGARQLLEGALEQLGQPRDREILARFYLQDQDKSQICSALGLSAAHFDRVLYRARQRMRQLISSQEGLKSALFEGLFDG